jgi:hypothetical protein
MTPAAKLTASPFRDRYIRQPPTGCVHGRMIFRTGAPGVAASVGSINFRR